MVQAFDSFIGWDEPQIFETIPRPFWPVLQELCTANKNLKSQDNKGVPMIVLSILDIQRGKDLDVSCEPNITLRQLEQKHVPEVAKAWTWGQAHSERAIGDTVEAMVTCGAFNEDGEIVSSVLLNPLGTFNVLFTPEKFRRRGYGELVMRWVSKQTAQEMEIHPLAEVEEFNVASKGTLEKVGYEEVYRTRWFKFNPSV